MTPISLVIREAANDSDREAAAKLIELRDDNHHPLSTAEYYRARLVLLAYNNKALVGTAAIKAGSGEVAELGYLMVDIAYRRQGVGAALTQARIDWARAAGIRLLWATVRAENLPSRDNLLKAGWQWFGNYLSIRGTGNTIGWYVLPLDSELAAADITALMAPIIGQRVPLATV